MASRIPHALYTFMYFYLRSDVFRVDYSAKSTPEMLHIELFHGVNIFTILIYWVLNVVRNEDWNRYVIY